MANSVSMMVLNNTGVTGPDVIWPGGEGTFHLVGGVGGASVSLQRQGPDGSTYTDLGPETTLTAEGMGNFSVGPSTLRALVTGGSPSGLYGEIVGSTS